MQSSANEACMQNERLLHRMSRGTVFGQLLVQQGADGPWVDCSVHSQSIPGDCAAIRTFLFKSTARQERLNSRSYTRSVTRLQQVQGGRLW